MTNCLHNSRKLWIFVRFDFARINTLQMKVLYYQDQHFPSFVLLIFFLFDLPSCSAFMFSFPSYTFPSCLPNLKFRPTFPSYLSFLPYHPAFPSYLSVLPFHPTFPSCLSVLLSILPFHPAFPSCLSVLPFHPAFSSNF